MRPIRLVAFTLLFLLVLAGHVLFIGKLAGQTDRGLITGTVTDVSGAAIPGATAPVKREKPGAQTAGSGSFDNLRFSGRANEQNAIRIDGVEATSILDASPGNLNGEISTGFRLQTSLETIQEFRVESSNYPAEFGTGTAGQISVVTKSGSNVFHGSMFEYLRNNALDSRNFFDSGAKSPLRLNQFGGS